MTDDARAVFEQASLRLPLPIAAACRRHLDRPPADEWQAWERLTRDVLQPVLHYLAHLLLADLVATGAKPAHLYHRVQAILSRPMAGHYVGFLRETTRYYGEAGLPTRVPQLLAFIESADLTCTLAPRHEPLLGKLVEYRNLFAHGRPDDAAVVREIVADVEALMLLALAHLEFLARYPLRTLDGTSLMGAEIQATVARQPLIVEVPGDADGLELRPLLVLWQAGELALLDDHDLQKMRLVYRAQTRVVDLKKKDVTTGEGKNLLETLAGLLARVRSEDAALPRPDWVSFRERAAVLTARTLSLYEDMRKYQPQLFVPRPEWEGTDGLWERFLGGEKTLLALSGGQGTGKSALVSHLAVAAQAAGHAVLLVNAQRFTSVEVSWSGNPYPGHFAEELHYEAPIDREGVRAIVKGAPPMRKVVLVIDAVDEVDGVDSKWNRFRAMELLLEWITTVAQPGLKVVLSFRVDSYEEFDYLHAAELPPALTAIAEPGTNPRHDWVTDLVPFDEAKARQLFEALQAAPELGMKPAMTWNAVREGLGERFGDFIGSPLLLQILLRAHHRMDVLLAVTPDALLTRFADKLTGADEIAKWPWWRRAFGFMRNANITPKEVFVVNLLHAMAEQGGASCSVDRLVPTKKRDAQILRTVYDLKAGILRDLKEGGLVIEDLLPSRRLAGVSTTRLAFTTELATRVVAGVATKRELWSQLQDLAIVGSLLAAAIVGLYVFTALSVFGGQFGLFGNEPPQVEVVARRPELVVPLMRRKEFARFFYCAAGVGIGSVGAIAATFVLRGRHCLRSKMAATDWAFVSRLKGIPYSSSGAVTAVFIACVGPVGLIEAAVQWGDMPRDIESSALIGSVCGVALLVPAITYWLGPLSMRLTALNYPVRLRVVVSKRLLRSASDAARSAWRSSLVAVCAGGAVATAIGAILRLDVTLLEGPEAYSYFMFLGDPRPFNGRISVLADALGLFAFVVGAICCLPIVSEASDAARRRFVYRPLAAADGREVSGKQVNRVAGLLLLLPTLTGLGGVAVQVAKRGNLAGDNVLVHKDALGVPRRLQFFGAPPSESQRRAAEQLTSLTSIDLGLDEAGIADLRRWPALQTARVGARTTSSLIHDKLYALTLAGPVESWQFVGKNAVQRLRLEDARTRFTGVSAAFPSLREIIVPEEAVRAQQDALDLPWRNWAVTVECAAPSRLEWLTPGLARSALRVEPGISATAVNLDLVSRLWLPSGGVAGSTLARAKNLRWLLLIDNERIWSPAWLRELAAVVGSLASLEAVEVVSPARWFNLAQVRQAPPGIKMVTLRSVEGSQRATQLLGGWAREGEAGVYFGADRARAPALLELLATVVSGNQ